MAVFVIVAVIQLVYGHVPHFYEKYSKLERVILNNGKYD